jgi:hypothetical protein
MTSLLLCFSLAQTVSLHTLWCGLFSLHLGSDYSFFTPCFLFSTSLLISSLAQLFLHISQLFFSSSLLDPFSSHLISSSSGSLLWIHSFSLFPLLSIPPPYTWGGVYLTILLGSMHIIPFSTNNIFIHRGISSNNLLLGPIANFLSTLLKDSLHSIENSTIYPSFTCSNQNSIALAHLLSTYLSLLTVFWSQTSDSWAPHVELIYVCLFIHSYNKQGNSTKKISCKYV